MSSGNSVPLGSSGSTFVWLSVLASSVGIPAPVVLRNSGLRPARAG
jgi:hypothetical protein